ncbi:hypothetical protein WH96_20180 [Kiloniella spongiae]|uniref:Glycosyl transferase family 1 domain-containing protein n=1 Tax=Kiloniella spongiae TaxID=1489064 RepID=A0A0H2M9Y0_9PROT|nr:glycosyltransferase family 4 protein [Kiloniella spongiae]KLN58946.1 hypothetical protein WH96_20180 [Kiloniella spongiae]
MKLCAFMTYGGSLKNWEQSGILDRELAIYRQHAKVGWEIDLISFGNSPDEAKIAERYPYFSVHYNNFGIHPRLYSWGLPFIHSKILADSDVYKTNQTYGAHVAHRCSMVWKKPVVVRQGYGHFENRSKEKGVNSRVAKQAFRYERSSLRRASVSIFTTEELAESSIARHNLNPAKVCIIPNYLIPEIWTPAHDFYGRGEKFKVIYFGRLSEEKNLTSLIDAARNLPVEIHLIGEGSLRDKLEYQSREAGVFCQFSDQMSQEELRNSLAQANAFVLPSLYEGHPKALIEALAYGIPVLAVNSPGIYQVVGDKDFSVNVDPTIVGIRGGLETLLSLSEKQLAEMGRKGRAWAMNQFSVNSIAASEQSILKGIANNL